MPRCRKCNASIPEPANFCQRCGVPQSEEAMERFDTYAERRMRQLEGGDRSTGSTSGDRGERPLLDRLSYALGWAGVVAGLAMLPNLGGALVFLGGIAVLPPIRRLIERILDRPIGAAPTVGTSMTLVAIGIALVWIV